jgi:stearoyl-CoA desaturase (delta-9 desaturase)
LSHGLWDLTWWQIVLYTLVTTHITIASVTIYLHRIRRTAPWICMRFLALLPLLAVDRHRQVTKEWVSIHRKHHAKCET